MRYGGIDLNTYINEKKITINLVLNWLMKLIYALCILHENKIVHLDIKINNIVIDEEDETNIRIIDFSISSIVTNNKKIDKEILIDELYSIYPYFYNVLYDTNFNNLRSLYPSLTDINSAINLFNYAGNTEKVN